MFSYVERFGVFIRYLLETFPIRNEVKNWKSSKNFIRKSPPLKGEAGRGHLIVNIPLPFLNPFKTFLNTLL